MWRRAMANGSWRWPRFLLKLRGCEVKREQLRVAATCVGPCSSRREEQLTGLFASSPERIECQHVDCEEWTVLSSPTIPFTLR